jgi:ribosomal protein L11 methyltransferase
LLQHDIDGTLALAQDALEMDLGSDSYTLDPVVNTEWVEQIKASYVPLRIMENLYTIPSWSEPEDLNALNIILEPGVAFGTGAGNFQGGLQRGGCKIRIVS